MDLKSPNKQFQVGNYFYSDSSGESIGPVTEVQLKELRSAGQIQSDTWVLAEDSSDWQSFDEALGTSTVAPPVPSAKSASRPSRCHEVDYDIRGDDMQIVEVELDPSEVVIAEAGAMNYMDEGISFEAKMGDGSQPEQGFRKMLSAGKRALTGELSMTHFTNNGVGKQRVSLLPPIQERSSLWICSR